MFIIQTEYLAARHRFRPVRLVWSIISGIIFAGLALISMCLIVSPAYALSAACETLNSKSGTTNYSANFPASAFTAGETLTVAFTDMGSDPKTIPEINSGQIRLNNYDSSTVFYRYSTYSGSAGPHSGSHNTLSTNGLGIVINAKGHLSGVTIVCSAPVAQPSLDGITPTTGLTTGGTSVTITGTNLADATGVSIGGVAATGVTVVSSTKITATAPAHLAGPVNVGVTTPGGTAVIVNSFTYLAANPPIANNVSANVPAGSVDYPITLDMTGGATSALIIGSQASHGTATASGTSITYTPLPGFTGADSFTYVASNTDGTSAPATVSITVVSAAPTLSAITPNTGITTGGTFVTITGTHLTDATDVSIGGVAATNVTIVSSTKITARAPAHLAVPVNVAVTTPGGTAVIVNSFTYVAANPPIASASSKSVLADSSDNLITLNLTGGAATSVAVATQAGHGTATASGMLITYTPNAGYSGPDSFTYTASNIEGTSAEATVTLTVVAAAPTLTGITPNTGTTAGGTAVTITGKNLSGTTRVIIGGVAASDVTVVSATTITASTPPHAAGPYNVAVSTAGGDDILVNSFTYIGEPIAISPPSGALAEATKDTDYNQPLSLSGGTAPFLFKTSGSVPPGLTVDPATGTISGAPTATGTYQFSVKVVDANNHIGAANYGLTVVPSQTSFVFTPSAGALKDAMAGEGYSQPISAIGSNGALVYSLVAGALPDGITLNVSTGELTGPVDQNAAAKSYAFTVQVRDANGATATASYTLEVKARAVTVVDKVVTVEAGSSPADVYLNRGATGGPFMNADLTFVEPPNAGTAAIIRGQLAQSGPVTTPSGWYLQFTPNPSYKGQARVGFRLTSSLGTSNTGTVTYNIAYNAEQVASDADRLVRSFVNSRQSMISSMIHVPGLLERRRMAEVTAPVTARMTPSENGMTVNFSTSLAQMESARDSADSISGSYSSAFNVWVDGAFLAHNDKDINGDKWGNFGMINIGADYLLNERALLGFSFHYDHMSNPTDEDVELTGNGWLAGPYASFEIGKGVFWNGSLLYGGSSNNIDTVFWDGSFETKRWMADTSIEGQWDLGDATTLTPKLRAVYFTEKVEDYSIRNSVGDTITIDGFNAEQFRISLGSEVARSFTLENGVILKPSLGVTGGFVALDGSGTFGTVKAAMMVQTTDLWMLDVTLLFDVEKEGDKSVGARAMASKKF